MSSLVKYLTVPCMIKMIARIFKLFSNTTMTITRFNNNKCVDQRVESKENVQIPNVQNPNYVKI